MNDYSQPRPGKIELHGNGLGAPSSEEVETRAREIAMIDERDPNEFTEADWKQARRELTQTVPENPGEPRVKAKLFWASGNDDGTLVDSTVELPLSSDPVLRSKQVLNTLLAGPATWFDSAISTSPLGSTLIQRGCCSPVANALTLRPGAATGFCPPLHPFADGIFSVGRAPCGFATGTVGVEPQAGAGASPCNRRQRSAAPPSSATNCAKIPDKLMSFPY